MYFCGQVSIARPEIVTIFKIDAIILQLWLSSLGACWKNKEQMKNIQIYETH